MASACLAEVTVPDCVRDHSCGAGGEQAGAGAPSESGGSTSGGSAGRSPAGAGQGHEDGGEGGANATSAGSGAGAEFAGESGAGGDDMGPECDSCLIREEYLDRPCAGTSYSAALSVQDGEPPFSWHINASRPGWSITATGSAEAKLENAAVGEGNTRVTVTATSRTGEHTTKVFDLVARDACLFAFTQLDGQGAGELLLFDPIAKDPRAVPLAHNAAVFDFAFSPDGRYLAYSHGVDAEHPRGAHLALVNLRTLEDEPLSLGEEMVSAFAWSPDSRTLATSYRSGGQSWLGAVRMPASTSASKSILAPVPAIGATELYWLGNRAVAYHAPVYPDLAHPGSFVGGVDNPAGLRTAFWAELGPSGFGAQQYGFETFPPDVTLRVAPNGFFMVSDAPPLTIFFAPFESPPYVATRGRVSLLSPSGLYAARFDHEESGQRLRIDTAEGALASSLAISDEDCPLLLAWSPSTERLACVTNEWNDDGTTQHGELRLFTLDEASGQLSTQTVTGFCTDDVSTLDPASCAVHLDQYAYGTDLGRGMARGFSPSGRRFAFTSVFEDEAFLYLADVDADASQLAGALYFARPGEADLATRLSFSPDDRFLLFQLGTELTLVNTVTGEERGRLTTELQKPTSCREDFSASPDRYCGSTELSAPWAWAADSKYFAYQATGGLSVVDISSPFGIEQLAIKVTPCGSACSGHYAFQPPLN